MTRPIRTRWGGITAENVGATGWFRVAQVDGVWWLVDPEGGLFLSKGVCSVNFDHDNIQHTDRFPYREACQRKYGSRAAWRAATAARLAAWGINSLGAWSDAEVAKAGPTPLGVTVNLDIGGVFCGQHVNPRDWPSGAPPDAFDPAFDAFACDYALEHCAPSRDDGHVIGWFSDNELRWAPDWRGRDELLTLFLNQEPECPGRIAALAMLRERYGDVGEFQATWRVAARSWDELAERTAIEAPYFRAPLFVPGPEHESVTNDVKRKRFFADCDAFVGALAERYFAVTSDAIRAADPNHLLLGCRFAYVPQQSVIDAAVRHLDVIGFNCYDSDPLLPLATYAVTGKPCLVGEFSFRGDDSGLPNTIGAGPHVATQGGRALSFVRYATAALKNPAIVGYHWFEHADQPAEGRFDGENSNYGTVTIDDAVYEALTRAMTFLNARAQEIHRSGVADAEAIWDEWE